MILGGRAVGKYACQPSLSWAAGTFSRASLPVLQYSWGRHALGSAGLCVDLSGWSLFFWGFLFSWMSYVRFAALGSLIMDEVFAVREAVISAVCAKEFHKLATCILRLANVFSL